MRRGEFIIKGSRVLILAWIASALALPVMAVAETRTISWSAVTTYSDGTPIESDVSILYNVYWTPDATLSAGSLRPVVASAAQTTGTFDPDLAGMAAGETVYFTAETVLSSGARSPLSPAYAWSRSPATLSDLFVGCPPSLEEGGSGVCTATALWSDGSMTTVSPAWSGGSGYASIGADGVLTASAVTGDQPVEISAEYAWAGVTRTASATVMIMDLSVVTLAEPKNISVSGPIASSPTLPFRLGWDPATSYTDGTPIPSGLSVDYSAYWTTDPALTESSLQPLVSSTPSTSTNFDPIAQGMKQNQRVYFTTRAKDATGKISRLSDRLPWKVYNAGPAPPRNGKIIKK